jgi:endonuclease/exonuclease/phosphatase family metal-dependent hydrolase
VRVLTWNVFHGRAEPPARRSLEREFAAALAGWDWDVALLQEVPPWWPARLAAEHDVALTSRNALLPVRRWLAERWPDLMRSSGGSANAILVRGQRIAARGHRRLRLWPERRVVQAVRLEPSGWWVANLHATAHSDPRARADLLLAASTVLRWSGDAAPVVLGGDLNQPRPQVDGFEHAGGHHVDHVLARGLQAAGRPQVMQRGELSDHAPVVVELEGSEAGKRHAA